MERYTVLRLDPNQHQGTISPPQPQYIFSSLADARTPDSKHHVSPAPSRLHGGCTQGSDGEFEIRLRCNGTK